jgi:hypothetical protein
MLQYSIYGDLGPHVEVHGVEVGAVLREGDRVDAELGLQGPSRTQPQRHMTTEPKPIPGPSNSARGYPTRDQCATNRCEKNNSPNLQMRVTNPSSAFTALAALHLYPVGSLSSKTV